MNEERFCEELEFALEGQHMGAERVECIRTYDGVGMLTMNKGLVIGLSDGSEFQVTVVKSKGGEGEQE